jgi:neutral ceramidase
VCHLMVSRPIQAGAAQLDITPEAGVHLSGDIARYRPARLALDPLYAKAIVFERDGRKLCFLALDVTIITAPYTARIREAASQATGIEPDAIMVHATQTHSAPSVGGFMLDPDFPPLPREFEWANGAQRDYSDFAADRAVEAIRVANDAPRPVQVGVGSCIEGRLAFNRRAVTRDGGIIMPAPSWQGGPLGPTNIRYIEGPIDPELGVLCIRDAALNVPGLIANYACHPVHVFPKPFVSADWPGALASGLQEAHGADCVAMVLNGACGNINPWPPFDPDYVEDHVRMGRTLAERAQAAIESLQFTDDVALDWRIEHVPIPLREIPPDELEHAQHVISEKPQPTWADESHTGVDYEWMVAASIYSVHLMRQRSPVFEYEVQVLRVGDAAFVGLPGEPFVECGLRIKLASPTYPTYIAHCTTHYVGYIPIREAFDRGGHEVNTRYWAKLVPEAIDLIVDGAADTLGSVFSRP